MVLRHFAIVKRGSWWSMVEPRDIGTILDSKRVDQRDFEEEVMEEIGGSRAMHPEEERIKKEKNKHWTKRRKEERARRGGR